MNPETEITSNFYGYHIYVSFWRARYWLAIGGCRSGDPDSSAYLRPRLNQDRRRAGGAPQAARMSSFVHPAQHL